MKISVFGGSGRTGIHVIQQALVSGYEIKALVRSPEKLKINDEKLGVLQGDIFNISDLEPVIKGTEAVVSALGAPNLGRTHIYSQGMKNIIDVMKKYGVKRLICISAAGVGPGRDPNFPFIFDRILKPLVLGRTFADMYRMEQIIISTDVNYTIMRPPMLTKKGLTGHYRVEKGRSLPKGTKISRADLAHFMVNCINDEKYFKCLAAIAY